VHFARGEVDAGLAASDEGDRLMPPGTNYATSAGYTYRAMARLTAGDHLAAITHAEEAVVAADVFGPWLSSMWKRQAYAVMVRAHWQAGNAPAARAAAAELLVLARRADSVSGSDVALTVVAALARDEGHPQRAESLVIEALALADRTGMYGGAVDLVELLAALAVDVEDDGFAAWLGGVAARHRRSAGSSGRWIDPIGAELEMARNRLGVEQFDARWAQGERTSIDEAVAQIAAQPRRMKRPATGWSSLTASELRVVDLVAEGMSNAAVAERLFISRRTVDAHLNHVYTKLGMSSRTELVAAALSRK
jgi:DNA-binding CsgD family transcriptional regulator